jgi:hypothetical protein
MFCHNRAAMPNLFGPLELLWRLLLLLLLLAAVAHS